MRSAAAVRFSLPPMLASPRGGMLASSFGSDEPSSSVASWNGPLPAPDGQAATIKLLHFVRHGQGYHNIDSGIMRSPLGLDARLTDEGVDQCSRLQAATAALRPQLVVSSPMTRTLQTAVLALEPQRLAAQAPPLLALEPLRETCNYLCDARRPLSALAAEMPSVDFSACEHEEDELWKYYQAKHGPQEAFTQHRESADLSHLAERARAAFAWVGARPEREIVLVGHQAFFWNVFNMGRTVNDVGPAVSSLPRVVDFGDDAALEAWASSRFANCECRSLWAEFPDAAVAD